MYQDITHDAGGVDAEAVAGLVIVMGIDSYRDFICGGVSVAPCQLTDDFIRLAVITPKSEVDRFIIIQYPDNSRFGRLFTIIRLLLSEF